MVVGRRFTGGAHLMLDNFTIDCLQRVGLDLVSIDVHPFRQKRMPQEINRFARSRDESKRACGRIRTMTEEFIIVAKKPS